MQSNNLNSPNSPTHQAPLIAQASGELGLAALSVCIGRFQIFHHAHLAMIERCLEVAKHCVVVLGSSYQARSPRQPFIWQERKQVILNSLPEHVHHQLTFLPLRDFYNMQRWSQALQQQVHALFPAVAPSEIILVGHHKDASTEYLAHFPHWQLHELESQGPTNATTLRHTYWQLSPAAPNKQDPALGWQAIEQQVPKASFDFLKDWWHSPNYLAMAEEYFALQKEKQAWSAAPYPPILVTVDAIITHKRHVLVIQRGRMPGKGLYALPGGFLEQHETVYQSALRELLEETGLAIGPEQALQYLKAVKVFDHPSRSQRGRVISHTHHFELPDGFNLSLQAGDDAASAVWMAYDEVEANADGFHDDHFFMLENFLPLSLQPQLLNSQQVLS